MESDSDLESLPDSDPEHNVPLVPCNIARAAAEGDLEEVRWWLEGHDSDDERDWVNAEDEDLRGMTLLLHACTGPDHDDRYNSRDDEAYVDLVRYLIAQGADVNHVSWCYENTAMSVACSHGVCAELVAELLSAGASPHVGQGSYTPLGVCLSICERPQGPRADVVTLLLRAGAELDSCFGDESALSERSVEEVIDGIEYEMESQGFHPQLNADELKTIKELVAGVRREGSWLAFRRAEQKASFRLWWLVARGRATTADPLLGRVAGLPNELRSKVLGYWCLAE